MVRLALTVVGHHHRHGSEEGLQVIGQFGTTCVSRVHRDESRRGRIQLDLSTLEHEPLQLKRKATSPPHTTGQIVTWPKSHTCLKIGNLKSDLLSLCVSDGQQLLRNDRQDLDVNSVELVEAAPGS